MRTRTFTRLVVTLAVAALAACSRTPPPPSSPPGAAASRFELTVPGRSSGAPAAAALGATTVIVWTASSDAQSDLFVSVSQDSGASFAPPVRVNDVDGDVRASGEQAAQVALAPGGLVHVAWPSRRDGQTVIRYALSRDSGKTFSTAVTAAGAGQSGARGWHSLALGYDGGAHLIWLDGRNAAPVSKGGHTHAGHKPAGAAGARPQTAPRQDVFHRALGKPQLGAIGGEERLVAAQVCFCCKTAIATAGERVFAA